MTRDEILNIPAGRVLDALVDKYIIKLAYEFPAGMWNGLHTYSTDIAAAWQVVEKMQSFELEMDYQGSWRACVNFPGEEWYSSIGDTAPITICRAALLAVMEAK